MPTITRRCQVTLATTLFALPGLAMALNVDADGLFETLSLEGGFLPDPVVIELEAGGSFDARTLGGECVGFINEGSPDVAFDFSSPTAPVNLYALSDADTTLVVRAPSGQWLCNDDTHGLNPLVRLAKPAPGRYAVWVGVFNPGQFPPAELRISEFEPDWSPSARLHHDSDPGGLLGLPLDLAGLTAAEIAEEILLLAEPGLLDWTSVTPIGVDGFSIEGLAAYEFPGSREPAVEIARLVVNAIDLESLAVDDPPLYADVRIEGLRLDPDEFADDELFASLALEALTMNLALAYAIEPHTGSLLIDDLTIESPQLGSLRMQLGMSGLDLEEVFGLTGFEQAFSTELALNRLSLGYRDNGLLAAAMQIAADDSGQTPAAMLELLIGGMRAMAIDASGEMTPMMRTSVEAAERFLRDVMRPEGTGMLSVSVNPQRPLDALGVLSLIALPDQAVDILGLDVRYQEQ